MNIGVCGIGALGTVFAVFLKSAGHRVWGIAKPAAAAILGGRPLRVGGIWGDRTATFDGVFAAGAPSSPPPLDLIILTVKSFDTADAVHTLVPLLTPSGIIVVAQNGYGNYETVRAAVGAPRTLLARIIFGARTLSAGHAEVTVIADDVRIGQPDNAIPADRVITIARLLSDAGIPASPADDIVAVLWDKILYNCALNPLGAIIGCNYGSLAASTSSRRVMEAIVHEAFAVTAARGIGLNWTGPAAYLDHFYCRLIPPTKDHYPSMYHDMQARKRLEIDALNGAIVRLAAEAGIAAPVNATITDIVRSREALYLAEEGTAR